MSRSDRTNSRDLSDPDPNQQVAQDVPAFGAHSPTITMSRTGYVDYEYESGSSPVFATTSRRFDEQPVNVDDQTGSSEARHWSSLRRREYCFPLAGSCPTHRRPHVKVTIPVFAALTTLLPQPDYAPRTAVDPVGMTKGAEMLHHKLAFVSLNSRRNKYSPKFINIHIPCWRGLVQSEPIPSQTAPKIVL